ncbi:MAG: type IV pilus assembly protein PilM [bacterium]|nr:type IV pilus assembly protein PilM [bacterium]
MTATSHNSRIRLMIPKSITKLFSTKPKSRTSLGLDIGSSAVKIVELTVNGDTLCLSKVGVAEIIGDNKDSVVTAIKKAFAEAHIATTRVSIGVSGQSVIVRYIRVPKMSEEDLSASLKYEAAKHIPFDMNEVEFDFQVLDNVASETNMIEVMLVAVKKDLINQRLELLKACDLEPVIIDVDSFATINAFEHALSPVFKKKDNVISLINIGAQMTNISILDNGTSRLTRDVNIAGADYSRAISEDLGIDIKKAEETKKAKSRSKEVTETIKHITSNLVNEIHMSFDYYESQVPDKNIADIYLSGGSSQISIIGDIMHEKIGVETHIWNTTNNLKISDEISAERIKRLYPFLTVAVGLALRSLNK